jgi:hypothetical protein
VATFSTECETTQQKTSNRWSSSGIWWFSPLYLCLANMALACIALIYPPHWIVTSLHERDLAFLNPGLLLVVIASGMSFIFGLLFVSSVFDQGYLKVRRSPPFKTNNRLYNKALLLIATTIFGETLIAFLLLHKTGTAAFIAALDNPSTGIIFREKLVTIARFHSINILAFETLFYPALILAFFIILGCGNGRKKMRGLLYFSFGSLSYLLVNFITFTRWPIMQYLLSMVAVYVLNKNSQEGVSLVKLFRLCMYFLVLALSIFIFVNALKTQVSGGNAIIGYIMGSYNNAAAVISGSVTQPFSDSSYVTLGALWNAPLIGSHLREIGISSFGLSLPSPHANATIAWSTWSDALEKSGLNSMYQWDTVFGSVFGDVSNFFPIVFFVYGAISQYLFIEFIKLKPYGVLLYIFFMVSVVTWFTSVFISNTTLDDYAFFSVFLCFLIRRDWYSSRYRGRSVEP